MKLVLLFGLMLLTPFTSRAAEITNLGAQFRTFATSALQSSREQQEMLWRDFEARNAALYRSVFDDSEKTKKFKAAGLHRLLTELPQLAPKMLELFDRADQITAQEEARFRAFFPDLAPDIPVIFLPSLFSFNGKAETLTGTQRVGVFIGVDTTAARADNLDILFSHEFFHAYHEAKIGQPQGQTMATPLWKEGFATYVSGLVNPGASNADLLMQPDLAAACEKPEFVSALAKQYLEVLKGDGPYDDWFKSGGDASAEPRRRGYCLGLKVIEAVAKIHQITEMVTWNEPRYSLEIEGILLALTQDSKN